MKRSAKIPFLVPKKKKKVDFIRQFGKEVLSLLSQGANVLLLKRIMTSAAPQGIPIFTFWD